MSFRSFSPKQKTVLTWWLPGSRHYEKEAIVCDGAVRSGKTLAMGLSFFLWAMTVFDAQRFGICGEMFWGKFCRSWSSWERSAGKSGRKIC